MSRALSFPFQIGTLGLPRTSGHEQAIAEQLRQLLFTLPGERVNRPDFGVGIQRLVFAGAGPETAAAAEYVIRVGVEQTLGDLIALEAVQVSSADSTLTVDLLYTVRRTGAEAAATFTHPLEGGR